jgi:hypothetical protein
MIRVALQHPHAERGQIDAVPREQPASSSSARSGRGAMRRPLTFPLLEAPSRSPFLSGDEERPVPDLKTFSATWSLAGGFAVASPG